MKTFILNAKHLNDEQVDKIAQTLQGAILYQTEPDNASGEGNADFMKDAAMTLGLDPSSNLTAIEKELDKQYYAKLIVYFPETTEIIYKKESELEREFGNHPLLAQE